MAWRECVRAITEAAGRPLTDDEVEAIASAVQVRLSRKLAEGMSPRDALSAAGKELSGEMALQAMLKRRDALNNVQIWADLKNRVVDGQEYQTERSILSGRTSGTGRLFGSGVEQLNHGLKAQILGPLVVGLKKAGLLRAVKANDRAFNLDVARELYRRKQPDSAPATGNAHAVKAAELFGAAMDLGRAMQNKAGAWIGELENYMGRQYHDQFKVRGAGGEAGYGVWRETMGRELDLDKTFPDLPPDAIEESLHDTWRALANGEFDASGSQALKGFVGPANLGKKVSQGRSFIFNDADSWFRYNEQFGKGSVMDAIVAGAEKAARDTALLQTFGTNPEFMYDRLHDHLIDQAMKRDDHKMVDRLKGDFNQKVFDTVTGRAMIPARQTLAFIGSTAREVMQLVKLGSVIFSALPDVAAAAGTLRYNGIPFWEGIGNQIRAIVPQSAARKEIAESMGVGIDAMVGHIVHRFRAEDGVPGAMARAVNAFHHLDGLSYWTEAQKTGMGLALAHNLARHAGKMFEALPAMMQDTLRRYGIEGGEWNTARATAQTAADGRNYLLPAHIADEAVSQKFQTYIIDQMREGLNEPSALAKTMATMGTRPGTVEGEIIRSIAQFKSFTITFMQRHMGRLLTRNGVDLPGVVYAAVGMTLAGYAGMTLKDLFLNRSPRQPQDALGWAGLVKDAMVAGGALGLLGDALLRDNVSGSDVLKSLLGPVAGTGADAIGFLNAVRAGSTKQTRAHIAEAQGLRLALANTPNLFYLNAVYSYFFPYLLQEAVTPGTIRRREKLMRDNGQTFVLRP